MKNSTHYRLRALACALLASAAMLGACDDDDPNDDPDPGKKPPVTLTDQIQYDGGDLVGIKSAIYVAEEDGPRRPPLSLSGSCRSCRATDVGRASIKTY